MSPTSISIALDPVTQQVRFFKYSSIIKKFKFMKENDLQEDI
jgi:hypothetical protein